MSGSYVQLGAGQRKFPDWINIDINRWSRPDVHHDLRLGLPMPPSSVACIYSEHVLEHLELRDGERLLADCASALREGGVLRIAMPDLASLVDKYQGDWKDQHWLADYPGIRTPAEMLNTAMREWGHRYVYDFEDLRERATNAGFRTVKRQQWGVSERPELQNLETRPDSLLIIEATFD